MEQAVTSSADMESVMLECSNKLSEVLDPVDDAGIEEIVEVVSGQTLLMEHSGLLIDRKLNNLQHSGLPANAPDGASSNQQCRHGKRSVRVQQ
jgi:hypothetical protein